MTSADLALTGLSEREVAERRARGQTNRVRENASRTYADIIRENVIALTNVALLAVGITLISLGLFREALFTASLVIFNVAVGLYQEVRAKRRLDRIALLTRPRAHVIRDGTTYDLLPEEIVLGDTLLISQGDPVLADGRLVAGSVHMDESLLTGETDVVRKQPGDMVTSGSICMSGKGYYVAETVGDQTVAGTITAGARAFKRVLTPLQQEVNLVLRVLLLMTAFYGAIIGLSAWIHDIPFTDTVIAEAVIAGLVPPGLFLMITIAYAMAALRLTKMDALIQQANAVESLSNVNVLCLDKTGTLTANRIQLDSVHAIGGDEALVRRVLGDFAASVSELNKTSEAIASACPGKRWDVAQEVPFSSQWKWSGVTLRGGDLPGTVVLGAPEVLGRAIGSHPEVEAVQREWAETGRRVLLLAHSDAELSPDPGPDGNPPLPPHLVPLAVLSFVDELRPHCKETLDGFRAAGIRLKIISGDNPETVFALARQAGLAADATLVSGMQLAEMSPDEFDRVAAEATVFGRITPQQKERLVDALVRQGNYVAMIGDGVNDVLSLKKANLGIAMQSGSPATRAAADIVLLQDSFAALPAAFAEGQRIRNGMQDILKLFLTRIFAIAIFILAIIAVQAGFPFTPGQMSVLSTLTVGIPAFFLAAWARTGVVPRRSLLRSLLHFVLPAAVTIAIVAAGIYLGYYMRSDSDLRPESPTLALTEVSAATLARDATTTALILCGLLIIVFAEPPTRFWTGGDSLSGDWRPTILAGLMLGAYVVILGVPAFRSFFGFALLSWTDYLIIVAVVVAWAAALRWIWRRRLLDRFLGIALE